MSTRAEVSGWAVGWTICAAVWMWILGFFQALAGLVGIVEDEIVVAPPSHRFQLGTTE